jgi:tetratricopeptide (TPR) repeat protein
LLLKDYQGAVADYDKAIALNPKCGGYYCNRGDAEFWLKMVTEAQADYNKSIELDPHNAQAYFNRGKLKAVCLTNYTEAIADFTKAIHMPSSKSTCLRGFPELRQCSTAWRLKFSS